MAVRGATSTARRKGKAIHLQFPDPVYNVSRSGKNLAERKITLLKTYLFTKASVRKAKYFVQTFGFHAYLVHHN